MRRILSTDYYSGFRTDMIELIPELLNDANLKILEIGAGDGGFRANFMQKVEYWIVEPDKNSAEQAIAHGCHVLNGLYEQVANDLPNNYFDLIICNDVIEHMPNWRDFLKEIQLKINKERRGILIGSIPNFRHFVNIFNLVRNIFPIIPF